VLFYTIEVEISEWGCLVYWSADDIYQSIAFYMASVSSSINLFTEITEHVRLYFCLVLVLITVLFILLHDDDYPYDFIVYRQIDDKY